MANPVKGFRFSSRTVQMLEELSEQTGMSPSAIVQAAIASYYHSFWQSRASVRQVAPQSQPVQQTTAQSQPVQQTTVQSRPVQSSDKKKKKRRKHK